MPVEIKLWKPEIAPQAIVMNTNGITEPLITGPPPHKNGEVAGMRISGATIIIPSAKAKIVPIFI